MAKASAPLATQDDSAAAVAVAKPQITITAATNLVKALAASRLREVRAENKQKRLNLEAAVGGHTKRIDDTVIDQAKAFMTRLALIANHQETSHQDGTELKKLVGKMGAIVGELQTIMLTSKAIGLFESVSDSDYIGRSYSYGPGPANPLNFAGHRVQAEARELLEQYEIVDDAPKGKRGKAEPKVITVAQLADDENFDEENAEYDDESDVDDE